MTALAPDPARIGRPDVPPAADRAPDSLADGTADRLPAADVTVANISLEGVVALRPRSAVAVTSGYLVSERPELPGFRHETRRQLDGWAADVYRRESQ